MKIFTYIKENSNRINKKNFQLIGDTELWKHLIYEMNNLGCKIFIDTDSHEVIKECNRDSKLSNVIAYPRKNKYIEIENDPNNHFKPGDTVKVCLQARNLTLERKVTLVLTDMQVSPASGKKHEPIFLFGEN